MTKIYRDYFETLKHYLLLLAIDSRSGIVGCSEAEINTLRNEKGPIPLAYEEYLRSIGKKMLFEFMDAEDMAFADLDYINNFANEVFENNARPPKEDFFVISERRNDYISLIYAEGDNPKVWIMSEYWDDTQKGENLAIRTGSFTELMNLFFKQTLTNHPASFYFVPQHVADSEAYIRKKYKNWLTGLQSIHTIVRKYQDENPLIHELNQCFSDYYQQNAAVITESLQKDKNAKSPEKSDAVTEDHTPKTESNKNLFQRLRAFFN